jgi:hypothetical protein
MHREATTAACPIEERRSDEAGESSKESRSSQPHGPRREASEDRRARGCRQQQEEWGGAETRC